MAITKSWLKRLAEGDTSPLEALYNRYAGALYSAALEITGTPELACNAVEAMFQNLWKDAEQLEKQPGSLFGKLAAMIRHHAVLMVHQGGYTKCPQIPGQMINPDHFSTSDDAAPGEKLLLSERARLVRDAFESLPEKQRMILNTAIFMGESCGQIASRLGLSRTETAAQCKLALDTLRTQWNWMDA
jgi:RNA polymerase sigma factor (sigma-70 family)